MVREFQSEADSKDSQKLLLAQGNDSSTTGFQWDFVKPAGDSPIQGTGTYQVGADLKGNGLITRIERDDAQNCTITLDNDAKLNFRNDHIVKVERVDGSTYEMKHHDNGALKEIKMPSGEIYKHRDGRWHSADGKETDREFFTNEWGTVCESSHKDKGIGILHYPDGTSISGRVVLFAEGSNAAITKVERFGETLAECKHDKEGYLDHIKLHSGEQWQRRGPMKWKSSTGADFNGNFFFEKGRHLRRKDVDGHEDRHFKPF